MIRRSRGTADQTCRTFSGAAGVFFAQKDVPDENVDTDFSDIFRLQRRQYVSSAFFAGNGIIREPRRCPHGDF